MEKMHARSLPELVTMSAKLGSLVSLSQRGVDVP
jgi:hypothetical protein